MDIISYLDKLGAICFYFLIGELILFFIFERSDKGKVATVKIHPWLYNLFKGTKMSPYLDTSIYVFIMVGFLVFAYVLSLSETSLLNLVQKFISIDRIRLDLISVFLVSFWIAKIELNRSWKNKVVWISLGLVGLTILSFWLK